MNTRRLGIKRTELYARVWSTPMVHLASEFGMSSVGLANACRRADIPLPPRGHWAKLKAGKASPQAPLPSPDKDHLVGVDAIDTQKKERSPATVPQEAPTKSMAAGPVVTPATLEHAHPLLRATQRYVKDFPQILHRFERHGAARWSLPDEQHPPSQDKGRLRWIDKGGVDITASLEDTEWCLRFMQAIFRALSANRATIVYHPGRRGDWNNPGDSSRTDIILQGERASIRLSQGYQRVALSKDEQARRKRDSGWAPEHETRPSQNFVLRLTGTEHQASRDWSGTRTRLESKLDSIVRTMIESIAAQTELRRKRLHAEEQSRAQAQALALERRRQEARAEQVAFALKLAEATDESRLIERFLIEVEQSAEEFGSPINARAQVWVRIVREELATRHPIRARLKNHLTPTSGWPPHWWSQDFS